MNHSFIQSINRSIIPIDHTNQYQYIQASDEANGVVPWHTIDASQSIDVIEAQIQVIADAAMERAKGSEIKTMFEKK